MKQKPGPSNVGKSDGIFNDPRFAHLVGDPRFKNIHKSTKSIKIDNRFKSMFNDDKFKVKYSIDKYGRRVDKSSTDDLEKFYDLSSDEEDETAEREKEEAAILDDLDLLKDGGDINVRNESDEEIDEGVKEKLQDLSVDYARGEATLLTDSSSDEEDSEDEDDELFIEHVWGELDNDAPRMDESTRRLAACNMDWDRIRASDIMVLCSSFLPPGGTILSVKVYPSEFGKTRMAEEEVKGPQELAELKREDDEDSYDSDDSDLFTNKKEDGDSYHMEKLRQYQLNRLKYYYAVIECDSVRTADKLYAECDGIEYESTATKLDLRFIPDEETFDDEPRDICKEMPDLNKYQPRLFTTTALQQAKVELTWDENDVERKELNEKMASGKLNEIGDAELRKYVAYSSEDEDEDDDDTQNNGVNDEDGLNESDSNSDVCVDNNGTSSKSKKKVDIISKYKNLLEEINRKEKEKKKNKIEMEFSWGVNSDAKSNENESKEANDNLTPFEKIIEKKREKKKARKVEIRQRKKAAKQATGESDLESEDDLPDGIDLNDPYFAEEFANGEFETPKSKGKNSNKTKKKKGNTGDSADELDEKESELKLLLDDEEDGGKVHFSLKKIQQAETETKSKKKRKILLNKKKNVETKPFEDDFKINVEDSRFSALYKSHLYNIDPTDSHYKKTKNMEKLIDEKLKRKPIEQLPEQPDSKRDKREIGNNILIKSIKRKLQQNQK